MLYPSIISADIYIILKGKKKNICKCYN